MRVAPCFAEGFAGQPPLLRYDREKAGSPAEAREASVGWCPWPESNQHSLRNSILSRARLPVPPQGPSGTSQKDEPLGRWRSRRNIAAGPFGSTRADVIMPRLDRKSRARYRYGVQVRGDDCDTCRRRSVTRGHRREPCVPRGAGDRSHRRRDLGGRLVFPARARDHAVPALPRATLRLLPRAAAGGVRRVPRRAWRAASGADGGLRHPAASRRSPMPGSAAITPASNGSSGRARPIAAGRSSTSARPAICWSSSTR